MRKSSEKIIFWMILYPFGIFLGIILSILRLIRIIQIEGLEKIKPRKNGLIIFCNHISLLDAALAVLLLFPVFIFHPELVPWSTPKNDWYRKLWFILFRPVCIPIDQENKNAKNQLTTMRKGLRALREGGVLVFFPAGTRLHKLEESEIISSREGNKMGKFHQGIGLFAVRSGASLTPVWLGGQHRVFPYRPRHFPIRITIGNPLSFTKETSPEEATQQLSQALLELADQ